MLKKVIYLLLALGLAIGVSACAETGGSQNPSEPGAITQPTGETDDMVNEEGNDPASVSEVDDDAESYYGQSVSVVGDVIEVYNGQMFRISDPEIFGGDDVLVLAQSASSPMEEGQRVQVTGVVQQYDQSELEQTLGIDIDDAFQADFDGQPIIVADQVGAATP